nr:helix-turn-helix domain-containing protein [Halodesulfurarchaeum formicicum]
MASARDQELTDRFETFYRQHESDAIADLARKYPRENKSLEIDWQDLFRFDPDFAEDVINSPRTLLDAAEEALGRYDLPVDKDLSGAHVRVVNLPEATEIRAIRAEHLGTLVSVQGIVRKATSVKPKIERAAFECLRCGTITVVPQADGDFQDPYQCDGCEREGPFQFLTDHGETEFVDAQKLRIQESPEGLAGGETPESIDMHIEDDITGEVSPGDHVTATGILRLDDSDMESTDSRVFDMYLEGVDVVVEDEEFEEMEISDAEREEIIRLSEQPDIYEQLVDSVAPTIYGFDVAKLAIGLQLFSGVTKHLPDGARIRGDVHILLVGDPGTGKCVRGDTTVTLADGTRRNIRDLVESNLEDPQPVDDGVFARTDIPVLSMTEEGSIEPASATKVWKREAPETMYRVTLSDGSELEITPSHPLFTLDSGSPAAVTGEELSEGAFVAVPRDTDRETDVIPNVSEELTRIRTALALSQSECGIPRTTFQHYERGDRNPGRESLRTVLKTFESRLADLRAAAQSLDGADWDQVEQIRQDLGLSQAALADEIGVGQTTVSLYTRGEAVPDGGRVQDAREVLQERLETALSVSDSVRALSQLVEGDLAWAEITDIEAVEPSEEWVYDLEVEGTHSYLSNNVLSHNSQILQYIRHIAPRSVYTSGKGSSSAGLTAAAVRDDFGEGQQWSLEAGALVLADKGIAAVDELDKMACVTGDTLVSLGDGELERIGELSREAAAEGSIEELENGRRIRYVPDLSVRTMTEDGSIEKRPVTAIHEYDAPSELCEVRLESGESLIATPDHPFFVFEAGERKIREAAELDAGTAVFVPQASTVASDGGARTLTNPTAETDLPLRSDVELATVKSVRVRPRADFPETPQHVYDLTVEGTHNFVANGMVVHNSDDRSAMHEALEQQSYHPDTEILLADGRRVEIGDFVDEQMAAREDEIVDGVDCEILPVDDLSVHSTDIEEGETTKLPVDRVSRHEAPDEFVRVTFSNGRDVLVTPEHPMFVAEDGSIETVEAAQLEAGSPVPAPVDWPSSDREAMVAADGGGELPAGFNYHQISNVETVPNEGEHATDWVYDVTVEPTNTFVSNGVILHNSISISKAGINATLKSRCSLLGAANPELGRFDRYETPAEQIDLEPALISRFDLIFTVTDDPDEEKDANLAEHILNTNYAGELNTHRTKVNASNVSEAEVAGATESVAPAIEPELMRKYIAYARSTCFPTMTEEAEERIREFYVNLRSQGTGEDSPVPVTARKLEAIVRLAEASARVRLSDTVELEDADRSLEIVEKTLKEIGMDPETGQYDADVIETGQSKSQRDRIRTIRELIADIEADFDEGAPIDEVLARAEEVDMDRSKAEHEIEKLKQKGEVYEPTNEHLRTT